MPRSKNSFDGFLDERITFITVTPVENATTNKLIQASLMKKRAALVNPCTDMTSRSIIRVLLM